MKTISKLILSTGAILGLSLTASNADAQNYYYGNGGYNNNGYNQGYNNNGYSSGYNGRSTPYDNLGQNIYSLDQYGNQMTRLYSNEIRNYGGCRNSAALLGEMRRFNGYTDGLKKAYRGSCPKTFNRRAGNVRDSLVRMQSLRKRARVSHQVGGYISQSYPLATYVQSNCSSFRPYGTPAPRPGGSYGAHPAYGYQSASHHREKRGFDLGSAIFGAIAGRIIHGAASH